MNEVNIPLLRKSVEWAEAEAAKGREYSEWYQGSWAIKNIPGANQFLDERGQNYSKSAECGTCYCIAGFTAAATLREGEKLETSNYSQCITLDSTYVSDISARAQEELGLTSYQADRLFHANNSIDDVRRIAENIAGERL